ncbi:MAG: BPL-N domain-containing protein [Bacteroidota bacterium]
MQRSMLFIIPFLLIGISAPDFAASQVSPAFDVAVYLDEGAWEAGVIAFEHFLDWKGLTHERVDASAVNATGFAARYRCLYMPGGYAFNYKQKITNRGEQNIRSLVDGGGAYIGICAGAYFAADHVEWEGGNFPYTLGLFKGSARGSLQEIIPWDGYAMTTIHTNPLHPITQKQPRTLTTLYFGGPAFIPDPGFTVDTIATWDAAGDQIAITGFPHGSGRVLLVGPHPEIEENGARDGTEFGYELTDPESEWGMLWTAIDWVLQRPITDTTLTAVAPLPALPGVLTLNPVRPNPSQDLSTFTISAAASSRAIVTVVDISGRNVATIFDGVFDAGAHELTFNAVSSGKRLPSGRYFIRLYDGREVQSTAFILLR